MPCGQAVVATYDLNIGDSMVLLSKESVQVQLDDRPFAKGGCRQAFICRIADSSSGFNYGQKLVAKRYQRKDEFVEDYICAHLAQSYAKKYNERNPPKRIRFLVPNRIMTFNGVRYSLEEYLEGRWQKHNNIFGMMESGHATPSAFSHFTYQASGQKLMILDVQGVGETFTDPAIVSTCQGMYGYTDTGMTGISEFFRNHKCTHICNIVMCGGQNRRSPGPSAPLRSQSCHCGGLGCSSCLGRSSCGPCGMDPTPLRRDAAIGANVLKQLNITPGVRSASSGVLGRRTPVPISCSSSGFGLSGMGENLFSAGLLAPAAFGSGAARIISV